MPERCIVDFQGKQDAPGPNSLRHSVHKFGFWLIKTKKTFVRSASYSQFQGKQDALGPNPLRSFVQEV